MVVRPKSIQFEQLQRVMSDLGYKSQRVDEHYVAFVRPGRELFVVLRKGSPKSGLPGSSRIFRRPLSPLTPGSPSAASARSFTDGVRFRHFRKVDHYRLV